MNKKSSASNIKVIEGERSEHVLKEKRKHSLFLNKILCPQERMYTLLIETNQIKNKRLNRVSILLNFS
jgi:hypothetical protein